MNKTRLLNIIGFNRFESPADSKQDNGNPGINKVNGRIFYVLVYTRQMYVMDITEMLGFCNHFVKFTLSKCYIIV